MTITSDRHSQLLICRVDELHSHPSYVRHHLTVSASKLSALSERHELAFREPLAITQDRTILDGYVRWELARLEGRLTLSCIEYQLSEEEALQWILLKHRRSSGLNDFSRILLALDLEPWFQTKARANQRAGGEGKGSSKLTEAERVDVRHEIATAAGVSVGNVSKAKQLIRTSHPEVLQALRYGEIRINRAWLWSKLPPEEEQDEFQRYQSDRGVKRTIRTLLAKHRSKSSLTAPGIGTLARRLSTLELGKIAPVRVVVVTGPGLTVFITEELCRGLGLQEELMPICSPNNP